jgi:hypothetical protein
MAASFTVRVIGPTVSSVELIGTTPPLDVSPIVARRPTTPLEFDGPMIEPVVSLPTVPAAMLVAAMMPEPELDPAGERLRS